MYDTFSNLPELETLPIGFNPALYISVNQDVAQSSFDPIDHYLRFGRYELRPLLPDGACIEDLGSRMLKDEFHRRNWMDILRELERTKTLDAVLQSHPRSAWLYTGFTLAAYLRNAQDVALVVDKPEYAAFHYLEFGLEEGRSGRPTTFSSGFVQELFALKIDSTATTTSVLSQLFALGASPLNVALSEADYWELQGFPGEFLAHNFDHEFYHAAVTGAGTSPRSPNRVDCVSHFIRTGTEAGVAISAGAYFDEKFYSEQILSNQNNPKQIASKHASIETTRSVLYKDWLRKGIRHRLSPNIYFWAKSSGYDFYIPHIVLEKLDIFKLHKGLPSNSKSHEVLDILLKEPWPFIGTLEIGEENFNEFITFLADWHVKNGNYYQAECLYWHVLSLDESHERALRHLADHYQRSNQSHLVHFLRQRVTSPSDSGWNTINLIETHLENRRFDDAANLLNGFPIKYMSDVTIARKRRSLARHLFDLIWNKLGPHISAYGVQRTQSQLLAAARACTPHFSDGAPRRSIRRVALVGNEDIYQCNFYRVEQKAEQLRRAGYDVAVFSPSRGLLSFNSEIDNLDAVIFFRVPAFPDIIEAITASVQRGIATFYEVDDLIFDTEYFPPSFESYAGQIDREHYEAMACGVPLFEYAMRLCQYGIASTKTIANSMKSRVSTGRVFEHHNAISRVHSTAMRQHANNARKQKSDAKVRLIYASGTKAHKEDFHKILEPALAEILRRFPDRVDIRLIGHFGEFHQLDPDRDPVTISSPVWDIEEYFDQLSNSDVNLSVLSASILTDAKSEIKWMEAAMFAIPSVLSSTETYRSIIKHGENGFLCESTEDFVESLDILLRDEKSRIKIGDKAREYVVEHYSIETMASNLKNIFGEVVPKGANRLKVVVVNVFFPPQAVGGATRVVHDNVKILKERYGDRYEIDVICTLEGGDQPFEVSQYTFDGVRVWAITAPPMAEGDMTPLDAGMGSVFERLLNQIKPDIVHFHCIQRLTASVVNVTRYLHIPYVITLHDGWWISPYQFLLDERERVCTYDYSLDARSELPSRAKSLVRPLFGASRLLAVSEKFADLHRSAKIDRIETLENGLPPQIRAARVPSATGRVRLAHIGGATRHKGMHLIRNALFSNSYSNLELLLLDHAIPPGIVRNELWGTTPVTISGRVPQDEVAALYAKIDVLLAPSIWPESYGLVAREAMFAGAWVIASNIGAIGADVIDGTNGFILDVSSYEHLARCLREIDRDHSRYLNSPKHMPRFRTAEDQVDELASLYQEVINETVG